MKEPVESAFESILSTHLRQNMSYNKFAKRTGDNKFESLICGVFLCSLHT